MTINNSFQQILDNLHEGIYIVDNERKITFWNKGAEMISGFSAVDMLEKHCFDNILNHMTEDGCHLCHNGCPLHATIQDGNTRDARLYLHHKNGYRVPIRVRTSPLKNGDSIIGAVEMFVRDGDTFLDTHTADELRDLAFRDQLTSLPNRRFLERNLELGIKMAAEIDQHLGIAFLDIDHFKRVNDDYGHDTGDDVLKMIDSTLTHALRSTDIAGRWGGEEFLCILRLANPDNLDAISEKVRLLVEGSGFRHQDGMIRITVSIGATMILPEDNSASLLKRADALMYESKRLGRNRTTIG